MAADAEAICAGMSWDELQGRAVPWERNSRSKKKNELLDKSMKERKELTKEENKVQIKPVVVTVTPPPKES